MEGYQPFLSLGLAIAAGLLIGLEREQSAPADGFGESFLGGARTHPLVALVGGLSMLLSRQLGMLVVLAAFAALVAFLVVAYVDDVRRGVERGLTSEAAFMVSFLLGALSGSHDLLVPVSQKILVVLASAVMATLLLSAKPVLQPLIRRSSREDVTATLKFLIVAVVVLPLLPDRPFGPWGVLNPRQIGWMLVLITGISFAGYAAIRLLGPQRGLGLTGVVGGLVSSTAVTLSMAGRARAEPRLHHELALAVVLASSIMFLRVMVVVGVVNLSLLGPLAWPLGTMALAGFAASAVLYARSQHDRERAQQVTFSNPVELGAAVKFALFFALVLLGSKAASVHLGHSGAYVAGLAAGAADLDAIALSMARLAEGEIPRQVPAVSVFLACVSNTVVKAVLAGTLGGSRFGRQVAAALAAVLAAGAAGIALARL
jgi:uncharacterized membrane protein (DUF4010 family)